MAPLHVWRRQRQSIPPRLHHCKRRQLRYTQETGAIVLMPQTATAADAEVVMRLYDLRREEKLRKARNWFFAHFKAIKSTEEFLKVAPYGSEENAYFRMVVSYWDMAAGFVNSGA